LRKTVSNSEHIPFDQQADLVEARLPGEQRAEVLKHTASCSRCAAEIASLERIVALMRTDDSVDPPEHVVSRAVRLIRTRVSAPRPSVRQRLAAVLQFDSGATSGLAYGLRSGLVAERQLLFNAGELSVELRVAPRGGETFEVVGQVLGPCQGGQVELRGPGSAVVASLNDMCEFALPPVPSGTYAFALHLQDSDVEVDGLQLHS